MTFRNFLPSREANCCAKGMFLNHQTVLKSPIFYQSLELASTHLCKSLGDETAKVVTTAAAGCKWFVSVSPYNRRQFIAPPHLHEYLRVISTTCHCLLALEKQILADCSGLKSLRSSAVLKGFTTYSCRTLCL